MKVKISSNVMVMVLWLSLVSCGQNQQEKSTDPNSVAKISLISPEALDAANKDILLIDVRTPGEYASGHIENSINIDYRSDDFKELIAKLDTNQEVYVYCKVGGRSARSAKAMEEMGFKKVYDLKGGIKAWERSGLQTVK